MIIRENEHSNKVALNHFSETEITELASMLQRVKDNISDDWLYVKKVISVIIKGGVKNDTSMY